MKFNCIVNEDFEFEFEDSETQNWDITPMGDQQFHVLNGHQAAKAKVLEADFDAKSITVEVNGNQYQVQIKDEYDQLVKKLGLSATAGNKMKDLKAPMPGLVLDVMVEVGQQINKGDSLLILEAMKMENVIKSAGDGIVKSILVAKGKSVDKGEVLLEME